MLRPAGLLLWRLCRIICGSVLLVLGLLSIAVLPAYVLVAAAYVSLVQAHALREVRRHHGDPLVAAEADGEGLV